MKLKVGDLVQLKSGGPVMTVKDILKNGFAICEWKWIENKEWKKADHEFVIAGLQILGD